MAQIWFLISLIYFGACAGLVGCSAIRLFAVATSPGPSSCFTVLRSILVSCAALLAILYGLLFGSIVSLDGWHEALRAGGADELVCVAVAVLLPCLLMIRKLALRPAIVMGVAVAAFVVYGRAFLFVAAGA